MAERYYCPEGVSGATAVLAADEAAHLARVSRLGVGAVVEVFDGKGLARRAEVLEVARNRVVLRLDGDPLPERAAVLELTLAVAVPKGERFDWLVEKATELGVVRLVPLLCERSVVDPRDAKLERLRRLVVEASKQSRRDRLMSIEKPVRWADFLGSKAVLEAHAKLAAHPGGATCSDWPAIAAGARVVAAVGPEGGFTTSEIDAARASGWTIVSLGATILRIETAGLALAVAVAARVEPTTSPAHGAI